MVVPPIGSFKPQMSQVMGVTAMGKSQKVKGNNFYVQMKKSLEREQEHVTKQSTGDREEVTQTRRFQGT